MEVLAITELSKGKGGVSGADKMDIECTVGVPHEVANQCIYTSIFASFVRYNEIKRIFVIYERICTDQNQSSKPLP